MTQDILDPLFGQVHHAFILRKRNALGYWETTGKMCAIKEMNRGDIQENRGHWADDPIKEMNAMQYLRDRMQVVDDDANDGLANVIHPLDIITDEYCLFLVLPFCNGGELLDRMADVGKFNEEDARTIIRQILNGIASLQFSGMCHRDISFENILLHDDRCVIIDMGMCLLIPYKNQENDDGVFVNKSGPISPRDTSADAKQKRLLLSPAGRRGKIRYMYTEIFENTDPFDGFAVDIRAVGVMLFTMATGFFPWNQPHPADDKFRFMKGGCLVQLLAEWDLDL